MTAFNLRNLLFAIVLATAGFFLAPALGLDGASLALGLLAGALLPGLLPRAQKSAPAPTSTGPANTKPRASTNTGQNGGTQTLFVGNLAFRASRQELAELFAAHGEVISARIVLDKKTRKPRGYGFVEMRATDAARAIAALDGTEFHGRILNVSPANERKPRTGE